MAVFSCSFLEGRCIDSVNNYTCICDPGYVGRNCDRDFDDCSSSPCNHGESVGHKKIVLNYAKQNSDKIKTNRKKEYKSIFT